MSDPGPSTGLWEHKEQGETILLCDTQGGGQHRDVHNGTHSAGPEGAQEGTG